MSFENNNSLALIVRGSMENGIPIPRNMLSHSEDAYNFREDEDSYKAKGDDVEDNIKI